MRWYDNGQQAEKRIWKNGKKHSEEERWYPNNQQKLLCFYQNG